MSPVTRTLLRVHAFGGFRLRGENQCRNSLPSTFTQGRHFVSAGGATRYSMNPYRDVKAFPDGLLLVLEALRPTWYLCGGESRSPSQL